MMESSEPGIDLLIYAHDGRGLGHVSRSVAVGAAVRRLDPAARVLLLTGFSGAHSLIGPAPLDWIKLPAYAKVVVDGQPRSTTGPSNLNKPLLVDSRSRLIRSVINEYRPACILVDHQPQGKSGELLPSISDARQSRWVLGLRGIVGRVDDVWSQTASATFRDYYSDLLWYGDPGILGQDALDRLAGFFGRPPIPVGYVSRLKELSHWMPPAGRTLHAGTIAVPWQTDPEGRLIDCLYDALTSIGDQYGTWRLFLNADLDRFNRLPHCHAQTPGIEYLHAIGRSRMAVVLGGYNSVTDVLASGIPAVVIVRDIHDREQHEHLSILSRLSSNSILALEENRLSAEALRQAIIDQLHSDGYRGPPIDLDGAQKAASTLLGIIRKSNP